MKFLIIFAFLMLPWLSVVTGCTGSVQGKSSIPAIVTLSFATNESGQIEVFSSKGISYGVMTTGTMNVSVLPGTSLKAVWTPAASDTNTAAYWIDSTIPNVNQSSGVSSYTFAASNKMKVQMHLLAPANVVTMAAPAFGITSWTINGVGSQVAAGSSAATISVRQSDDFQVTWNANGSSSLISVWDAAGVVTTDRSKKDLASTPLVIGSDTTITAELTTQPLPHYRIQIQKPPDGELDFTNAQSGNAIVYKSNDSRYGSVYEVLTDNTSGTSVSLAIAYHDDGSGHALGSYIYLGQTTNVTTSQGATPNSDTSLTFDNNWSVVLANAGSDAPLTLVYDDAATGCMKIGGTLTGVKCY